jgi:proteic killer suppression protein
MIQSFACRDTEALFQGNAVRAFSGIEKIAMRKLAMMDAAVRLADLLVPPGNRLEKLVGNRAGQHSIRINDQYRICFVWTTAGPEQVEIVDYH